MQVQLFTNGTLLHESAIHSLLRSGVDIVKVSLWGSTPEEYALCHKGVETSAFGEILASLSTLSRLKKTLGTKKPLVYLNHVLTRTTYEGIGRKVELALETGCNGVLFHPFIAWNSHVSEEELAPEQIRRLCGDLIRVQKRMASLALYSNVDAALLHYRLGKSAYTSIPCYTGWYQARIRVDGAVMPCVRCHETLGDLSDSSFESIWNGEQYRLFRRKCSGREGEHFPKQRRFCEWCCTLQDNYRVHRLFKWVPALLVGR